MAGLLGLGGIGGIGGAKPPAGLLGKYFDPSEMRRQQIKQGLLQAGIGMLTNGKGSTGEVLGQSLGAGLQGANNAGINYRQDALGYQQLETQMQEQARKRKMEAREDTEYQYKLDERDKIMGWMSNQSKEIQDAVAGNPELGAKLYTEYKIKSMFEAPEKGTDDMQEYQYSLKDPKFSQYMIDLKRAGADNITIGDAVNERKSLAAQLGLTPDSPAYKTYVLTGKMPREDQGELTATDKKAILEADELVASNQQAIDVLQGVLTGGEQSLNKRAGSGMFAGTQSFIARNDPTGFFNDDKGEATTDLNNAVIGQALSSMKTIFGGNPTEGERKILIDLQASVDKTPNERELIFRRAIDAATRRMKFNKNRADSLRGQTYYKPQTTTGGDGVPEGISPDLWNEMTPEQKSLWK